MDGRTDGQTDTTTANTVARVKHGEFRSYGYYRTMIGNPTMGVETTGERSIKWQTLRRQHLVNQARDRTTVTTKRQ